MIDMMREDKVHDFFRFARERQRIYLSREAGNPSPWTDDEILQSWYFTNVYRELDRTTKWYRENVRDHYRSSPDVLPATVLFRWFNRISIGEYIFQHEQDDEQTLWEQLINGDIGPLYLANSIRNAFPKGPYVNGAYIIKGYDGMNKLNGVVQAFWDWFIYWRDFGVGYRKDGDFCDPTTIEGMTRYLATFNQLGMFMAYEVACDLRHTGYLENAPDINLWANPGPGARRGLSRLYTDGPDMKFSEIRSVENMLYLLDQSRYRWPEDLGPKWEMREVEHTLCEFDKYERIRQGGRGKRTYNAK